MTRGRSLIVAAVLVAALLVLVGRLEHARERDRNLDGIELVRALVGSRVGTPTNFRVSLGLTCVLYPVKERTFALELCLDPYGRVIEAADRRGSVPVFYTVVAEPQTATVHLDAAAVDRWIIELQSKAK